LNLPGIAHAELRFRKYALAESAIDQAHLPDTRRLPGSVTTLSIDEYSHNYPNI
jgi:hypothetical protein